MIRKERERDIEKVILIGYYRSMKAVKKGEKSGVKGKAF